MATFLVPATTARASGFTTANVLFPGGQAIIDIVTSSANEVITDVVMLFGLSPEKDWRKGDLGYPFISTKILGRDLSNNLDTMRHFIDVPVSVYYSGPAVLSAALVSMYNTTNTPITTYYYAKVNITRDPGVFISGIVSSTQYFLPSPCNKKSY
ncbi:uncharacterized protein K489DRAFT_374655 [Dissoconium aciculare CBS 342.82]|uniref:Uncharacterized protein n=1 Tax=Dissoconium aciculare CBS 342.82 TaxID=1314786 RepID=A0A6J3LQZ6_9PEZI|nr:uncharacterized protein K489DRAFT_374655 [Dissoconium aciculare CBS 342.82]KAF1818043.1 hypothetical protein K489DRAFT_374655 [Dissoconium aciculare CBS 342.82]